MPWQNTFNAVFGPGLFGGITFGDWIRMLRINRFAIHPRFAPRFFSITAGSLSNSMSRFAENRRHGAEVQRETVLPPLFVLGHWRSGTTHLHNLLSQDDRFAFPSFFQVLCPHAFLNSEKIGTKVLAFFAPPTRGIDNVKLAADVPYEDEFALASMSECSPYITMAFPRSQAFFDRFLTLRDAQPAEVERWKSSLTLFLKKLTFKYKRPLILKSPTHTCRIKLLLELFPAAKFVHIRRHPFEVFRSTMKMVDDARCFWQLQKPDSVNWEERVIRQYREMDDVYSEERGLIPAGRLHELSFEDLEADPIGQVRAIYHSLQLPDFTLVEPSLQRYVDSIRDYQKNPRRELPPATRTRLAQEWRHSFERWGYPST